MEEIALKIIGVVIAIFLLLIGVGIASIHSNSTSVKPADIFSSSLNQDTASSGSLYTGSGYFSYLEADYQISMPQLSDIYTENGQPIIYSTFSSSNAASTLFSQTVWVNFTHDYVLNAPTFGVSFNYTYYVLSGNEIYQSVTGQYSTPALTPSTGAENYGPFQIFNNAYFKGAFSGIVVVKLSYSIYGVNDNALNDVTTQHGSLYREVYIGQTSAALSAPSPIADGQTFDITYSTGYGQPYTGNNNGPFYQLSIYGSQAYDNGKLVKTFNLNPEVNGGVVSFTMPSNAWVYSTDSNANDWKAVVTNGYFNYNIYTLVAVKSLSLIPPTPTINITNTPSSGDWIVGNQVDVVVHTQPNVNSKQPITSINVFVYTGLQENEPSTYIIGSGGIPLTVQVNNNNATFAFTIPQTSQGIFIQVNSFDSGGETSAWTYALIGANHIYQSKHQATVSAASDTYLTVGVVAAIVLGSGLIAWLTPTDFGTKVIIILGYVGMWLIILASYVPL